MPEDRQRRKEQQRGRKERGDGENDGRGLDEEEKKEVGCLVCFSEFDSESHLPAILPCGHAFCHSCLRHPSLSPAGVLRCPLCRHLSWGRDTLCRKTSGPAGALQASAASDMDRGFPCSLTSPERPHGSIMSQLRRVNQSLPAILEMAPTLQDPAPQPPLRQLGASSAPDESWFMNRCALCCRRHSADSYPLDCLHSLCPRCLDSLLTLASPGWVTFLYCPQCSGQTAVFGRPATTHVPTVRATPEQGPAARPRALEQGPSISQCQCCCGIGLPCTLL